MRGDDQSRTAIGGAFPGAFSVQCGNLLSKFDSPRLHHPTRCDDPRLRRDLAPRYRALYYGAMDTQDELKEPFCAPRGGAAAGIVASIFALSLACAGCGPSTPAVDPATLVKDGCEQDPDLAFKAQVIAAAPFRSGEELDNDELLLTVDPNQWRNLGYGMRQQLIAIFDCADAGPGKYHTNIIIRSTDGTDLMKAPTAELMQWRAGGLANLKQDGLRSDVVATDATVPNRSPTDPGAPPQ